MSTSYTILKTKNLKGENVELCLDEHSNEFDLAIYPVDRYLEDDEETDLIRNLTIEDLVVLRNQIDYVIEIWSWLCLKTSSAM